MNETGSPNRHDNSRERKTMDADAKKIALRMIPYGLYVLTARNAAGQVSAATVNWVTQTSFAPPLIAVGVKADSGAHALIEETGEFVLNVLGKGDGGLAFAFFKPAVIEGNLISGAPFVDGTVVKAPVLTGTPAHVECRVVEAVKKGDHSLFVAEVVEVAVRKTPEGRADDATLWMKDLGEKVFYGG
jgi:flavin reductase (DIM6/NTAB) family NADH-FMN oxidoreductase RutF